MTFEEFVESVQAPLLRMAVALTGDIFEAQDLLQATLARCWLKWDRVNSAHHRTAYAKKVLYTTFISERRHRRPRLVAEAPDAMAADITGFDEDLFRALRALPPRQRAVIVARYLEDLSEKAAAEQLGCSVGTIKSQTYKALRALRDSPWLTSSDASDEPEIRKDSHGRSSGRS